MRILTSMGEAEEWLLSPRLPKWLLAPSVAVSTAWVPEEEEVAVVAFQTADGVLSCPTTTASSTTVRKRRLGLHFGLWRRRFPHPPLFSAPSYRLPASRTPCRCRWSSSGIRRLGDWCGQTARVHLPDPAARRRRLATRVCLPAAADRRRRLAPRVRLPASADHHPRRVACCHLKAAADRRRPLSAWVRPSAWADCHPQLALPCSPPPPRLHRSGPWPVVHHGSADVVRRGGARLPRSALLARSRRPTVLSLPHRLSSRGRVKRDRPCRDNGRTGAAGAAAGACHPRTRKAPRHHRPSPRLARVWRRGSPQSLVPLPRSFDRLSHRRSTWGGLPRAFWGGRRGSS